VNTDALVDLLNILLDIKQDEHRLTGKQCLHDWVAANKAKTVKRCYLCGQYDDLSHTWVEYLGDVSCIDCDARPWGKFAHVPCEAKVR
jgi:hypothetical protein